MQVEVDGVKGGSSVFPYIRTPKEREKKVCDVGTSPKMLLG